MYYNILVQYIHVFITIKLLFFRGIGSLVLLLGYCGYLNFEIFWDSVTMVLVVLLFEALDYTVHLLTVNT